MTLNDKQRIKELERQNRELRDVVDYLYFDRSYGILTRGAIELEIRHSKKELLKYLVYLDIDYLHEFNNKVGHDEANNRIRRALHFRSSDLVICGRWYSGDEIVIIIDGDPLAFCARLGESFSREEMSATTAFVPFSGRILEDVKKAKKIVDEKKAKRGITR